MDAFYASVEQRDNSILRGKPVAVGHEGKRGVVAAASYEARMYGVRSAMPSLTAKKKCPHLIFVPARFDIYHDVSAQIRELFLEYTNLVEPLSLDEAFLDVSVNHKNIPSATLIARELKQQIRLKTGLNASAGISFNKFLAKIASDHNKPNGIFTITPEEAEKFIETIPIERFFGIGKVASKKMHEMGVFNGLDLKQRSIQELVKKFGKAGIAYYQNARAIDLRPVNPNRITKSISSETTFETDKDSLCLLHIELSYLVKEVVERMKEENFYGRTITLKIKYSDFKIITRSVTLNKRIKDFQLFFDVSKKLLDKVSLSYNPIRLLGVGISNNNESYTSNCTQLELDLF